MNGIVHRYAEPPFHCDVHHVTREQDGLVHPVIVVPGGHKVPIRCARDGTNNKHVRVNTYYIRRPGPKSEQIQSGREWDEIISRCVRASRNDMLDLFRDILYGTAKATQEAEPGAEEILELWVRDSIERWRKLLGERVPDEVPSRYQHGVWTAAYMIRGDFKQPSLKELLEVLERVKGHETGWPCWLVPHRRENAPYSQENMIECWIGDSMFAGAGHSDFWRASPDARMFLLRGYQEDDESARYEPGTALDFLMPIWRIGECLLHASRLASTLNIENAEVHFAASWSGLAGRHLVAWDTRRWIDEDRISRQDNVSSYLAADVEDVEPLLAELVAEVTRPLYDSFNFLELPAQVIQEELTRMRSLRS